MIILIAVCRIEERGKNEGRKLERRLFKELRYEVRQVEDTTLEREKLMREVELGGSGSSKKLHTYCQGPKHFFLTQIVQM